MTKKSTCLYIITKSVWGGAAKYVFDLATNLSGEFEVAVAAGGKDKFYQEIKKANLSYYNIYNFQRNINPFRDIFAFFEILSLLFQIKPEIIHVNSSKAGGITGVAGWIYKILSSKKIKLIFTTHGWAFAEHRPKLQLFLIKLFSKLTCLFYDKIICVSKYDYKIALKNKIAPDKKLITIHNGIDINKINFLSQQEARKKLILNTKYKIQNTKIIGTIAEWTDNKGLFYLLRAIKKIKDKKFDVILIGSGENPDKEKMYDFVKKNNLKNIYLIEFIDNAVSYLKAFDIFVLPSLKEGLPYTILEAMAAEIPIIATNVGGVPEMFDDCGIIIQPKNSQILAEKIIELINNPDLSQETTKKARQRVEKEFGLKKMLQETKKLYY